MSDNLSVLCHSALFGVWSMCEKAKDVDKEMGSCLISEVLLQMNDNYAAKVN